MCGINGIVQLSEVLDNDAPNRLYRMLAITRHRGPDGQHTIYNRNVALGINRLAIVGLDDPSAIYCDPELQCYAVFNGEITNHVSLRQYLGVLDMEPASRSDGALILPMYRKFGWRFVDYLCGMFAIAVYDGVNNKLLLYRDRAGIKPLYFYFKAGVAVFSSEIKAIRAAIDDHVEPEFAPLDHILRLRFHPGRTTPFPNIQRVLPAESVQFQEMHEVHRLYWSLHSNSIEPASDAEGVVGDFRDLYRRVIRENGAADVAGGFFVSGGLDSVSVAAVGALETSAYKTPISLSFTPQAANDERYLKQLRSEHLRPVEWVPLTQSIAINSLLEITQYLDEPLENPIHVGTYLMAKRAKELGIKTVMTGDGADEFFLGYERHRALFELDPVIMSKEYFSWIWNLTPEMVRELYTSDAIVAQQEALDCFGNSCESFRSHVDVLDFDRRERMPEYHCMRLDRMTMANGVEAKVPFLDHRIMEYSLQIPVNIHYAQLGKDWLRQALAPWIPVGIVQRQKEHFPSMPQTWLRSDDAAFVKSVLLDQGAKIRAWFHQKTLERWIGELNTGNGKIGRALWACLALELWLSQAWVQGRYPSLLQHN